MNVNRVTRQNDYQKAADAVSAKGRHKSHQTAGGDFYESLSGNLYGQAANQEEYENTGVQKPEKTTADRSTVMNTSYQYYGITSGIQVHTNGRVDAKAIVECSARNISYAESDYVKTYVEQGFTFKASVNVTAHMVYVEQKYEDGTVKGYEVDYGKLNENSQNPVEQMALEAWNMVKRAMMGDNVFHEIKPGEMLPDEVGGTAEETDKKDIMDMTVEEALAEFYAFIQDRIENGPPKYLIGSEEYSAQEWEKLLEGVDGQLEDIREEIREWIEQRKEQEKEKELLQEKAEGELQQAEMAQTEVKTEAEEMEALIHTLCTEQ